MLTKFVELAIEQAEKSDMYFRHGAVLFHGNQLVNIGRNRLDRIKIQKYSQMCSTHAEIDCSRRLLRGRPSET